MAVEELNEQGGIMPLPFILLGVSTVVGGFGVKKGLDATSLYKRAHIDTLQAQNRYDTATLELKKAKDTAQIFCDTLGSKKVDVYKTCLIPFVAAFSKIKNVDFQDGIVCDGVSFAVTEADFLELIDISVKMSDILTAGIGTVGGGGLTALALYGGAGLSGATTAGTVAGCASGAMAANGVMAGMGAGSMAAAGACAGAAGMAGGMGAGALAGSGAGAGMAGLGAGAGMAGTGGMAMGGGAGAMAGAGGMGMGWGGGAIAGAGCAGSGGAAGGVVSGVTGGVAGGTVAAVSGGATGGTAIGAATLGGIVAGPFLALGGLFMAARAQKAKANARTNYNRSAAAVDHMKTLQITTEAVSFRVYEILYILCRFEERFAYYLHETEQLVSNSADYTTYADHEKKIAMMAALMAKTIKNIMEAPVLDEQGTLLTVSGQIIEESRCLLQAIAV